MKEQASGFYAQTMAERGFVTLAFDPSYTGESGGEPRHVASPDINTEDFSAAVDCLGLQSFVDREKIGIIGICGWGGFALNATAIDTRIKAVATMVMYDMSRVFSQGYFDSNTPEMRLEMKRSLNAIRWTDAHSRYMGEDAYKSIGTEKKELLIVPNARHTDFYDNQAGVIPFDKLESFFKENLQQGEALD